MKNFQLIPNWKQARHMFSIQAMAIATALINAWAIIPADMKSGIPGYVLTGLTTIVLIAGMLGRLLHQPVLHDPVPCDPPAQ